MDDESEHSCPDVVRNEEPRIIDQDFDDPLDRVFPHSLRGLDRYLIDSTRRIC